MRARYYLHAGAGAQCLQPVLLISTLQQLREVFYHACEEGYCPLRPFSNRLCTTSRIRPRQIKKGLNSTRCHHSWGLTHYFRNAGLTTAGGIYPPVHFSLYQCCHASY